MLIAIETRSPVPAPASTVTPASFASWMMQVESAPAAPITRTLSPAWSSDVVTIVCAVPKCRRTAVAVGKSTPSGTTLTRDSRSTTSSAYPPNVASAAVPATRSPTFSDVTPSPTASTTPDGSMPGVKGNDRSMPETPATICTSKVVLTDTACTRTSTSPSPGTGSGTSSRCNCSGPPNALTTIAFMGSPAP